MNQKPQIYDVVLFTSKYSNKCQRCEQFIKHHNLRINNISIDTKEAKEYVMSASNIKITHIPTIVVYYQDGTTQVYITEQKILMWLQNLINSISQPVQQNPVPQNQSPIPQNQPTILQNQPTIPQNQTPSPQQKPISEKKKTRKTKGKNTKNSGFVEPIEPTQPVEIILEEVGNEGYTPVQQPIQSSHNQYKQEYDEPKYNPQGRPIPPTKGLMTGGVSNSRPSNTNIMEAAQRMMADRNRALKGQGE